MILFFFFAGLVGAIPYVLRRLKAERDRERLANQFRATLQNLVHALRVGVGFQQALDYVAREGEQPLAQEWSRVLQALRLGQPLHQALETFTQRVKLREVKWFVTAVNITQSTGGSLADVLDSLASTLQEQQNLREKIGALTAQGKASGILIATLPYALMGALSIVAPEFVHPLFSTNAGQLVIAAITISLIIGGFVIKKIVTIEVE
jgi:tight adherence protein B